jgi:CDP-glycerol glycerophosphotransferase
VRNVSAYPDVNDLYLASDALVTDYSSAMVDYAVTGKPILLHVPDLTRYRDDLRGHYLELEEVAPGPVVADAEVLLDHLQDLEAVHRNNAARYARFRERFCALEDGNVASRVWDLVSAGTPGRG